MKLPRVLKFRVVTKIFRTFGITAERGKTSGHRRKPHWMLMHPDGRKFPIPAHGDNTDISRSYIEAARRRFSLAPEDGVADEEFYGRR